jgi:hypothetical protein
VCRERLKASRARVREEGGEQEAERDVVLGRKDVAFELSKHAGHPVHFCRIAKGNVQELVTLINQIE